jgi:hypothetical protein
VAKQAARQHGQRGDQNQGDKIAQGEALLEMPAAGADRIVDPGRHYQALGQTRDFGNVRPRYSISTAAGRECNAESAAGRLRR